MIKRYQFWTLVLLLGYLDFTTSCGNVPYMSRKDHSCSLHDATFIQSYKDVLENGDTAFQCCRADETDIAAWKEQASKCFMSQCYSKSVNDYCPTRYIDEKTLKSDEIFREPCTIKGKDGITAYCCPKGSLESQLASTYGAEPFEFPHQVKLFAPKECGATIYNEEWILTAAHCVVNGDTGEVSNSSGMSVLAGTNSARNKDPKYKYKITQVVPHKDYSKLPANRNKYGGDKTLYDVALLKLDRKLNFGPHVKALEIAPEGFEPRDYADQTVIAGWDTTYTLDGSDHLQKTNLLLRDPDHCFATGAEWAPLTNFSAYQDQLLCIGGILRGKWSPSAGAGDSGGPAVCRGPNGKILQCGVTSFGTDDATCLAKQHEHYCYPSIYARVSFFNGWIKLVAGEQDENTLYQPYLYGEPVSMDDYNHQVHITSKTGKSCGGTLISEDTVVTAASCVFNDDGSEYSDIKVNYGLSDLTATQGSQVFGVGKVSKLEGFKRVGDPVDIKTQGHRIRITDNYYEKNLAVVKLNGRAPISRRKLPKLPGNGEIFKQGRELALPRNTNHGGKLLGRDFKILGESECQKRMTRLAKGESQMGGVSTKVSGEILCGVEIYSGGSTCDRELGGGLICKDGNDQDVLCGVQTFRLCEWSLPNAFMDMSKQASWVMSKM